MAGTNGQWRNRIVGYCDLPPDQFLAHEKNFRRHPKSQQDALSGVLHEVGIVQNVIVSKSSGKLLDGHLRVELALRQNQKSIPVTYVELSEAEEAEVLATLDPLSALAFSDKEKLDELLREVHASDAAVVKMLADLAAKEGLIPKDMQNAILNPKFEVVVECQEESEQERTYNELTRHFRE